MQRLITHATVLSMDSARPSATAFAIDGDRISAVGQSQVLLAQRTRNTEVVDLGGRTVVPGFIGNTGRIRLEHLFWARDAAIQRLQATGAGVVTRMDALYRGRGPALDAHDPKPPMRFPIRALRAAGVEVGDSSDAPCFGMPPLWGVGAAVHRHNMEGVPVDVDQAVSVEEALRIHTLAAAWADGTEDIEGSITPGKLANFVVLAQDPRSVPPVTLRNIQVDETWVDGRRAYCRASTSFPTATEKYARC